MLEKLFRHYIQKCLSFLTKLSFRFLKFTHSFIHSNCNSFFIFSLSQGDLTEEADSNLYINPLEATEKCGTGQIKKSISSEVGRSIAIDTSPSAESLKVASKINLNTIPKHKKIRIQQVSFFKNHFYLYLS